LTSEWAEILLGALAALQFARVQDGRYHLTDTAISFLLPESPFYAGEILRRYAARDTLAQQLTQKLRTSVSASDRYIVRDWKTGDISLDKARDDVATQHAFSAPSALAMSANGDFAGVRRLLDVAGGSGVFALALAQKHPEIHCTVAELPVICQITDEYIAAHGLVGRVDTTHLNMFFEDWPTDYDAILLSSVLHDWGAEHRGDLMRRAYAALPDGGRLYIHEMVLSDARDGPLGPALFSVNMRVTTLGKQFTVPELRMALEEVGFTNVTVQNTYGYFSLVCARKPRSKATSLCRGGVFP
jgi:hypothetical protein